MAEEEAVARAAEADAIAAVIAAREAAWNAGDVDAYRAVLTPDAEIVSATGRPASGRDALLALFVEQRAGAYAGVRTFTRVRRIDRSGPDAASVEAEYRLEGGTGALRRTGRIVFGMRREGDRWRIATIRGIPDD